jgi:hypothetical protein
MGCATHAGENNQAVAARVAETHRIQRACSLPAGTIIVKSDGSVKLRPRADELYKNVDCALTELRKSGVLSYAPMGFVGNERYDENMQ